MKKLLFESNVGIQFVKEVHSGMCFVKVQTKRTKRAYTLKKYVFRDVELVTSSPLLSWENLNCCNGWQYDEAYLFTAVQEGKKPYAGLHRWLPSPDKLKESEAYLEHLKSTLPETCAAGKGVMVKSDIFPFYICRRGCLKDFFDLRQILEDYERLGVYLSRKDIESIHFLSGVELERFATNDLMCYYNVKTDAELVATGLLLGYPLESTASILLGN